MRLNEKEKNLPRSKQNTIPGRVFSGFIQNAEISNREVVFFEKNPRFRFE
jgi:hypothetical protein